MNYECLSVVRYNPFTLKVSRVTMARSLQYMQYLRAACTVWCYPSVHLLDKFSVEYLKTALNYQILFILHFQVVVDPTLHCSACQLTQDMAINKQDANISYPFTLSLCWVYELHHQRQDSDH